MHDAMNAERSSGELRSEWLERPLVFVAACAGFRSDWLFFGSLRHRLAWCAQRQRDRSATERAAEDEHSTGSERREQKAAREE